MAVRIRLARRGRKKLAIYDIVVSDSRSPRNGRFIEKLGLYNPNSNPATVVMDTERTFTWLMNGALPTDTARTLLSEKGIMMRKHLQLGVIKGAITQEVADKKFHDWVAAKEAAVSKTIAGQDALKVAALNERMKLEAAKKEAIAERVKAKKLAATETAKLVDSEESAEAPAEEAANNEAAE